MLGTVLRYWAKTASWVSRYYVVTSLVPKRPEPHERFCSPTSTASDTGIVMQGPLCLKDDFTYQTLRAYRAKYPDTPIVLSTWRDQCQQTVGRVRALGIEVLELDSVPPGVSNINLQIHSTSVGLRALVGRCTHALKTRTDQRFGTDRDFLGYFQTLQHQFPVRDDTLTDRLITLGSATSYARLYFATDYMMFGRLNDLLLYWDVPRDERPAGSALPMEDAARFVEYGFAEGYLLKQFMSRAGYTPEWTPACSNRFLSRYFCVIDSMSVSLFWYKYHWYLQSHRKRAKTLLPNDGIGFVEWLQMYRETLQDAPPESPTTRRPK